MEAEGVVSVGGVLGSSDDVPAFVSLTIEGVQIGPRAVVIGALQVEILVVGRLILQIVNEDLGIVDLESVAIPC